jgi:hypothetical protein
MHRALFLFLSLGLALLLAPQRARAAEPPVLAVLEYSSGLLAPNAKIRLQTGAMLSPLANRPNKVWTLRDGDTLRQAYPPAERVIQFYRLSGNDAVPVCRILVKFRQTANGWRPAYMLNNPPPVMWDGNKLVPLDTGAALPVQMVGGSGADADGFYTSLSLGSPTGAFPIDGWAVQ